MILLRGSQRNSEKKYRKVVTFFLESRWDPRKMNIFMHDSTRVLPVADIIFCIFPSLTPSTFSKNYAKPSRGVPPKLNPSVPVTAARKSNDYSCGWDALGAKMAQEGVGMAQKSKNLRMKKSKN